MNRTFLLARPSNAALVTMRVLTLVVAVICIVPALYAPWPVSIGIMFVDAIAVAIVLRIALRMQSVTFSLAKGSLDIKGDLGDRSIRLSTLNVASARRLDRAEYELARPVLKLNGVGAPGYLSGWFKLRSGEKAYIYVTDKDKAVYVPTTEGYALLLTPEDPDGLLTALRAQ